MSDTLSVQQQSLRFKVKIYPMHEYLVYALFLWYLFYTGLVNTGIIPNYGQIDDLIFFLMLGLSISKLVLNKNKFRLHPWLFKLILAILVLCLFSLTANLSSPLLAAKYIYIISRPFILLFYISIFDMPVERIFRNIVTISRFLILINLPAIIFNLITYNVQIIEFRANDKITGFFPFQNNNEQLVRLYAIVLLKDFYDAFIIPGSKNKTKSYILFALEYLLLLSSVNLKNIIMLTSIFGLTILLKSRHKVRNILLFSIMLVIPAIIFSPYIQRRFKSVQRAPVFETAVRIFGDEIEEFSMLIGTGPGTFTSPTAIDADSPLAYKYGLFEIKASLEQRPSPGTLSRLTSSALTLLGDIGVVGVILYILFILLIIYLNYRNIKVSYICFIGFAMGLLSLALGLFLDYWFWGLEIFLATLGVKYAYDLRKKYWLSLVQNTP